MFIKICEFCKNSFKTNNRLKVFCTARCQRKNYNRMPEIKEINRLRTKEYRRTHPEWKERHRILAVTKNREKRALYWKDYGKRPEIRARINEKERLRRKTDMEFAIRERLRRSFKHALTKYSKEGKVASSKKYGINWGEVIDGLKPFPEEIEGLEIDHVRPLHSFNLSIPEEIKLAFDPSNLQWLTREENRRKSGKIM